MESFIVYGVIGAMIVLVIFIYNRLVTLRQKRNNAFSDIDVQLKQRYNLVPQLVETVKGYASHENEVFTKVTEARAQVGKSSTAGTDRMQSEGMLGGALLDLFAVAENYPDLKADANFRELQNELSDIENKIAAARRFYNSTTSEYNAAIQQFPAVLVAGLFGFKEESFFEIDDELEKAVQQAPDINFA